MNDVSPNSALSLKKTFSIQSAYKKQSNYLVTHKEQFSIQFTHKEQSSHTVTHKGQSSTQSVCQKQPSNSVILKEPFNISATPEEPLSLISPVMELDTPNHIAQTI